jgi:hypothetical protein
VAWPLESIQSYVARRLLASHLRSDPYQSNVM